MLKQQSNQKDVNQISPLGLAYIGDCVYELLVREYIIAKGNTHVKKLHTQTVSFVCAIGQSRAVEIIMPTLSEAEIAVYKRGRNANGNNIPKNATPQDYRRATGFESLMGYLYLTDNNDRIIALFDIIMNEIDKGDTSDQNKKG